jgi:hypothetical protein
MDRDHQRPYSPDPSYLRLSKDGNPNDGTTYDVGDNHVDPVDEREVVDQSFLGLVLFGAKTFDDPVIRNSLAVTDKVLRVQTPSGPVFHRFTFDGYGETATGADWDIFPTKGNQTFGRRSRRRRSSPSATRAAEAGATARAGAAPAASTPKRSCAGRTSPGA